MEAYFEIIVSTAGRFYSLEDLMEKKELVPKCSCGGIIKPDVVLYEENLNQKTLEQSVRYISQADMLIVGGTSLTVYPAAGLIDYYRGNKLVLINMAATVRDGMADLIYKKKDRRGTFRGSRVSFYRPVLGV